MIHDSPIPNMSIKQFYCMSNSQSALMRNIDEFANLFVLCDTCCFYQSIPTISCPLIDICGVFVVFEFEVH